MKINKDSPILLKKSKKKNKWWENKSNNEKKNNWLPGSNQSREAQQKNKVLHEEQAEELEDWRWQS